MIKFEFPYLKGSGLKLQTSTETTRDENLRLHTTGDEYIRVGRAHRQVQKVQICQDTSTQESNGDNPAEYLDKNVPTHIVKTDP